MRTRWLLAALLVAATFVAYLPAIDAGFIWDDEEYVTHNRLLDTVSGLGRIWTPGETPQFYPVVFTTFWVEHHLWGNDALGYHLVNVALHVVAALLAWRLARRVRVPGAWMIAAVFALRRPSPAQEAVTVARRAGRPDLADSIERQLGE